MAHGDRFRVELRHEGLFWLWVIKDSEHYFQIANSGTTNTKIGAKWAAKRAADRLVKTEQKKDSAVMFDY